MVPADQGRAAGLRYRPILTSRRGGLAALTHLDPAAAATLAPILEIHPPDPDTLDALRRLPVDLVPAVDLAGLPDPLDARLTDPAHWGVPLLPVIGWSRRSVTW